MLNGDFRSIIKPKTKNYGLIVKIKWKIISFTMTFKTSKSSSIIRTAAIVSNSLETNSRLWLIAQIWERINTNTKFGGPPMTLRLGNSKI
jgi:hypothetical protein